MDFPDNGLPKLCPLTLISPHQSPYSKNFREGTLVHQINHQNTPLAELKQFFYDRIHICPLDHDALEASSGYFSQKTCTHNTHRQRCSISASPIRIMIIIIVGNSHHTPLLHHFLKRIEILYSSSLGEVISIQMIIILAI